MNVYKLSFIGVLIIFTLTLLSQRTYSATPDTTPPLVTIKSPLNNSILSNTSGTNVVVAGSDTSGIKTIQISIDSILVKTCANTTSCSYWWALTTLSNGIHTIQAMAIDKAIIPNSASVNSTVTKQVPTPTPTITPTPTLTPTQTPTVTPTPTTTPPANYPTINGSSVYISRIQASLTQIKTVDPANYALLLRYVKTITESTPNKALVTSGDIIINTDSTSDVTWAAGSIIHEMYHIYDYNRGVIYNGCDGEANSISAQAAYLRKAGKPDWATQVETMIGTWC